MVSTLENDKKSSIYPFDRTLTRTTTPGKTGFVNNGNEEIFHIPQSSRTVAPPSDGLEVPVVLWCNVKSHNTAVDPDEIHYELLRPLPPKTLHYFLTALNNILKTSRFLVSWQLDTIIPILKQRKNSLYPSNYRPMASINCFASWKMPVV